MSARTASPTFAPRAGRGRASPRARSRPPARPPAPPSPPPSSPPPLASPSLSRRALACLAPALALLPLPAPARADASARALIRAFDDAMAAGSDFDAADAAWTRAIDLAPTNAAAWSNRGTKRLQAGRWRDARDDLERSVELSPDPNHPDALTLNNLGNAQGALGEWDAAAASYLEASKDRELESIALANLALARFQTEDVDAALRTTATLLRRDPEFWDARAAAAAFMWADGREADAEAEWARLCRSGRGFGASASAEDARADGRAAYAARLLEQQLAQQAAVVAGVISSDGARRDGRESGGAARGEAAGGLSSKPAADDTPCALYASTKIVAPRWPPRCTAALDAFLKVSRVGEAMDYDGKVKEYRFP